MSNPHDHLKTLEKLKGEVQAMPKVPEPPAPEPEMDLDKLLEDLAVQVQEPEPEPEPAVGPEEMMAKRILETLWNHPDAPSKEQIASWKSKYGEHSIQVLALDPQNVFIYTHLTWSQWEKLQSINERLQTKPDANIEKLMRDNVIKTSVLWPRINDEWFTTCRAGLPSSLYELILINSYFLTPQQTMALTTKL